MVALRLGVAGVRDMQLVACSQPALSTEVGSVMVWAGVGDTEHTTDNSRWEPECTSLYP